MNLSDSDLIWVFGSMLEKGLRRTKETKLDDTVSGIKLSGEHPFDNPQLLHPTGTDSDLDLKGPHPSAFSASALQAHANERRRRPLLPLSKLASVLLRWMTATPILGRRLSCTSQPRRGTFLPYSLPELSLPESPVEVDYHSHVRKGHAVSWPTN
jgi:hypothetical protein